MRSFCAVLFLIGLLLPILFSSTSQADDGLYVQQLCPNRVVLASTHKVKFTDLEKIFLCGDPKSEPWKDVPLAQARFHIGTFLQDRGYHSPEFSDDGNTLYVGSGPQSTLDSVKLDGAPEFLKIWRRRKILDLPLTPKLLNEIESWVQHQLQVKGYACPKIRSEANVLTGEMLIHVEPGPIQTVESVTQESLKGLGSGTLRRYDAFVLGKKFNKDLLTLTAERVEKSGVLQSTSFNWECELSPLPNTTELYQRTFAGKPRIVTFGFGADTEEYVIVKGSWKHTRWGSKASNFGADMYASYRQQKLDLFSEWYAFSPLSRWYLKPTLSFWHDLEVESHFISSSARFMLARTWDWQTFGMKGEVGPELNYVYTFRGAEPGWTRFLALETRLDITSHDFELWQRDPHKGYSIQVKTDFTNKNLFSELSAQKFSVEGKYYYNLLDYDPALLVVGVRGGFFGTYMNNPDQRGRLPPNYRFYLGGSQSLRGFGRLEIPGGDGALSAAFVSSEVRLARTLPLWVEPFLFFDIGIIGNQAMNFNLPFYMSPGFGLRIASPIGVLRGTVSHGLKTGNQDNQAGNTHFQYFVSYGEEF